MHRVPQEIRGGSWRGGENPFEIESTALIPDYGELPISIAYGEEAEEKCTSRPPLRDLGYKNIEHCQDYSDYRRGKAVAGIVIPWMRRERQGNNSTIGRDILVELKGENAEFGLAETRGSALAGHRASLEDQKAEMSELGLSVMIDRNNKQALTATQAVIDHTQQSSTLKDIVVSAKDAVETTIEFHAKFMAFKAEDACSMDLGYSPKNLVVSVEQAKFLLEMVKNNALTLETMWAAVQHGGILSDSFDPAKEKEELKTAAAKRAIKQAPL